MLSGLDIGTTGCKISVFQDDGTFLFSVYHSYEARREKGQATLEGPAIFNAVKQAIAEALKKADLTSIGIDSFGESFLLLDENDAPLTPVMLQTDSRGEEEAKEVEAKFGKERIASLSGVAPSLSYSLPKLAWIKAHWPEAYAKAKRVLLMEDYVLYLLTGNAVIDESLACRTMGFDIQRKEWSQEIFGAMGLDSSLFSRLVPTGSYAGDLKPSLIKEFGLSHPLAFYACGHDQIPAAIGAGILTPGQAVDGAGTCECITPCYEKIPSIGRFIESNFAVVPYLREGLYTTYAYTLTSGSLVDWFVSRFAQKEQQEAKTKGEDVHAYLESRFQAGPTGILCLPHFAGAATPYMDNDARGAFVNLSLEHSTSDLYQAVLEGIAYEMRLNLDRLRDCGIEVSSLVATGGGASSKAWLQIKADVTGLPIHLRQGKESGARGCALLCAVATGLYPNLQEASRAFLKEKDVVLPDKARHEAYSRAYEKYKAMYACLKGLR